MRMKIQIITLFPEVFVPYLQASMLWKAHARGIASYELINLRDYGLGPRKQVDDTPYGGGDGMLLRVHTLAAAVEAARRQDPTAVVVLPTPRGEPFLQSSAKATAASGNCLILICPRYEGYDERITEWVDKQ